MPGASLGVVAPDSMIDELSEALTAAGINHGTATRTGLDAGVTLVPVSVVKGLELDGVVVVEPARIVTDTLHGLRALYVALTRSTRRLTVVQRSRCPTHCSIDALFDRRTVRPTHCSTDALSEDALLDRRTVGGAAWPSGVEPARLDQPSPVYLSTRSVKMLNALSASAGRVRSTPTRAMSTVDPIP